MIGGDLSGVQRFIYTVAGKGAARSLKGRSFFLQLLSEAVSARLLEGLGLNLTCQIYNSGGHFYLLAPNMPDFEGKLDKLKDEINSLLLEELRGEPWVVLASIPLRPFDFKPHTFAESWSEVMEIGREKRGKFSRMARDKYSQVFGPFPGGREECTVCRAERPVDRIEGEEVCYLCQSFEELGKDLRQVRYLMERHHLPDGLHRDDYRRLMYKLSGRYIEAGREPAEVASGEALYQVNEFCLSGLTPLAFPTGQLPLGVTPVLGYRVVGVHTPEKEGKIADFDELAKRATGAKKLGVVRMDVDKLGQTFKSGLGDEATPSRVATLSSLLSDFFEGYISHLLKRDFKDHLYLIYSGGDDLFIVGSWDKAIEAAAKIEEEFRRYTGGALTLSAGVVVADPKDPILHLAHLAGESEERAKAYRKEKDALTLFETSLGWEELLPYRDLKDKLYQGIGTGIDEKRLPTSFLWRLYDAYNAYLKEREIIEKEGKTGDDLKTLARWHRWRWQLVYSLRGYAKEEGPLADLVREVQAMILDKEIEEKLRIALRWAELLIRELR